MPNSLDILKEKTLSNGQAIGLVVAMFAIFEFYYSGSQTTEMFNNFLMEEKEYREEERATHDELKSLSYRLVRECEERVNARMDRKTNPLRLKVEKQDEWIWEMRGRQKASGGAN